MTKREYWNIAKLAWEAAERAVSCSMLAEPCYREGEYEDAAHNARAAYGNARYAESLLARLNRAQVLA